MKIALRANANGLLVAADDVISGTADGDDMLVSFSDDRRPLVARANTVGAWEQFELLAQDVHGDWQPLDLTALIRAVVAGMLPAEPVRPPQPVQPPDVVEPPSPGLSPREQFTRWIAGKPFGQQTLLDLEPTMKASGWLLTPPNADGARTKIHPPGGPWTRVGFGEGTWQWIPQAEQ